ncbi:MAG TPA: CoA pyrophosphatase [Balneolaceae bacterium]|nr:CoA pyrophosphatase [Balneolaceae bacterium]
MVNLITYLSNRLDKHLPGQKSQLKMAPQPVSGGKTRQMAAPVGAHQSSVLVLLFPNDKNKTELALTLRSSDINHGGQISFPGGRAEKGETAQETALREAHEEIGICPEDVTIVGELSELYVSHSNNRVTPVVGFMDQSPEFCLNPSEVEEIFTVELDSLLLKKNLTVEDWDLRSHTYKVPYWDVHRVPLWGATAMMLSELLDLYREFKEY